MLPITMSLNAHGEFLDRSHRPPAPWKSSPSSFNLNWHHIIPWAMMRDAWQALVVNRDSGKCRVALASYMRLLRVDQPKQWLKDIVAGGLTFDQQEILERKLTWPSWNIVEGPYFRTDDPKDHRSLDDFTAGLTRTEWSRQQRIKSVFSELQIFNQATPGGKFSEEAAVGIASVMNNVERSLVAGDLIFFRKEMWSESKPPRVHSPAFDGVKWWRKKEGVSFCESFR